MNFLYHKVNYSVRWCMLRTNRKNRKVYKVQEHMRSGGTWVSQVISELLDIDFPRNKIPNFFASCILHSHSKVKFNMNDTVVLWRCIKNT